MDGFEFRCFLVSQQRGMVHAKVLRVIILFFFFMFLHTFLFVIFLDYFLESFLYSLIGNPLVIPPVNVFIVDVVFVRSLIFFSGGIIIYNMKWKKNEKNFK